MSIRIVFFSFLFANACLADSPWSDSFDQRLQSPPQAQKTEGQYCQSVQSHSGDFTTVSPEKLEQQCSQQGVYASTYLDILKSVSSNGDTSCSKRADKLQVLADGLKEQSTDCDASARQASAAAGTAAAAGTTGQTNALGNGRMRDAEVPIRQACIAGLQKVQQTATSFSKQLATEQNTQMGKMLKVENERGWNQGGVICNSKRNEMTGNSAQVLQSLTQLSKAANAVASKAQAAGQAHQAQIKAIQDYDQKILGLQKKLN